MTQLERADHLLRRKLLYEAKHPETKYGGDRGNQYTGGKQRPVATLTFAQYVAQKTGKSERSITRSIRHARAIAPEVKAVIRGMPEIADSGVELDALAALTPVQQESAIRLVLNRQAVNVRAAARQIWSSEAHERRQAAPTGLVAALRKALRRLTNS